MSNESAVAEVAPVIAEEKEPLLFPKSPPQWVPELFNELLIWGVNEAGMSDIKMIPNTPMMMRIDGKWQAVTSRKISVSEISPIVNGLYRQDNASARLMSRDTLDWEAELKLDRATKLRFRCQATQVRHGVDGPSLTIRTIPSLPPEIGKLDIEPELMAALTPNNGLVLVTGVMGSGKSTTLAAVIRYILENQPRSIGTFEDPIEFQYADLQNTVGIIEQSGIHKHINTFTQGVISATRRAFDVVLMGEARDSDTLGRMIELAELGPAVYSTVHTRGVAETPPRIIQSFPAEERPAVMASLVDSLRVIVQQRLLRNPNGGRTAIREFLIFTQDIRDQLLGLDQSALKRRLAELIHEEGQSLVRAAELKLEQGLIFEKDLAVLRAEREREDKV